VAKALRVAGGRESRR